MLLALTAGANPQLDPANPTGFFTNVAMAMFQQMNLHDFNGNLVTVTNIPIYEDPLVSGVTNQNYYTPAVHRVLQLAVNIFDATQTNYPTVFRPVFQSKNGVVYIVGFQEVTDPAVPLAFPFLEAKNFVKINQGPRGDINMYGVPWVIGAKKGFPNFNEFSMVNPLMISRKLRFTNTLGQAARPNQTNQIYDFAITNTFGFEAWNSYTNVYGNTMRMIVSNELRISLTNETGFSLITVSNLAYGNDITFSGWPGWSQSALNTSSFKVPLSVSQVFTNGNYTRTGVIPLNPIVWSATFVPHLFMVLENRIRYVLIDQTANRVIDFVNIDKVEPPVDISVQLYKGQYNAIGDVDHSEAQWNTNLNHGFPIGVFNQIQASLNANSQVWTQVQPNHTIRTSQAALFNARLLANGASATNNFQAPFAALAIVVQRLSWQANDPLVHYVPADIISTNGYLAVENSILVVWPQGFVPMLDNLTNLNFAYQPWGGRHYPPTGSDLNPNPFSTDVRVKDPNVQQSDNWNFPNGESLSFEWLGRVHRGTPWQTVSLKPSPISSEDWVTWANDNVLLTNGNFFTVDAALTLPNNDWHLASLWARWLNTTNLSTSLSINNTDTNAWAARLDGLIALTNSALGELDPLTITSNSPQAGIIAQAIQAARATTTSTNGIFQDVGDVLAIPQLSVASPFINTNGLSSRTANGITDEALEKIPTQLLPLLRVDSFGKIVPANGLLEMSFSGYDGHAYAIEASSNLTDWVIVSTNCPSDGKFGITNTETSGQQYYRSVLLH